MSDDRSFVVAVAAVIVKGDRLLAMRRAPTKDAGRGLWETLSGRVEPGEQPLETMQREILEESGLTTRVWERPVTAYAASRASEPMIVIVYRADWLAGAVRRSSEHDAHVWCTPRRFSRLSTLQPLVEAAYLAMRA